jgi:5-methylcytosine-specific restriction endonuclease McrA
MRVDPKTWKRVFKRDKGICQYCRVDLLASVSSYFSATVDHVVAVATGGDDSMRNLKTACPACNSMLSRKKALQTFEERRAFVQKRREEEEKNLKWWRSQVGRD